MCIVLYCIVHMFYITKSFLSHDTVDGRNPASAWLKPYLVGGWATPLKSMSQLGWWTTQFKWKNKTYSSHHQPDINHGISETIYPLARLKTQPSSTSQPSTTPRPTRLWGLRGWNHMAYPRFSLWQWVKTLAPISWTSISRWDLWMWITTHRFGIIGFDPWPYKCS